LSQSEFNQRTARGKRMVTTTQIGISPSSPNDYSEV
jgi:hypothetical protein